MKHHNKMNTHNSKVNAHKAMVKRISKRENGYCTAKCMRFTAYLGILQDFSWHSSGLAAAELAWQNKKQWNKSTI